MAANHHLLCDLSVFTQFCPSLVDSVAGSPILSVAELLSAVQSNTEL